jgi:hypothetical protein
MDKTTMIEALKACGLKDDGLRKFHRELERRDPEGHAELLRLLKIPEAESQRIREASR